jgi:hypothetical protein
VTRRASLRPRALAPALALVAALLACEDPATPTTPVTPPLPACPTIDDFLHTIAVARPPGVVFDAALAGDIVFAAGGADGLHVLDLSNPADPRLVDTLPLTDARALDVDGPLLCVADAGAGVVVVDISTPSAPTVVGTVGLPGSAVDVDVAGSRAYVANRDIGLVIVDVTHPAAPAVLGIENTPGAVVSVAAREPLVFAADETNGLRIVNVADPSAPFIVKTVAVPGAAKGVAVMGDLVVVAAREGDVQIVDASVPAAASIVGVFATPRDAIAVAVDGEIAFVAEGSGGIEVADLSEPASPRRLQGIGTASGVANLAVAAGRLVVADAQAGVRVMHVETPLSPAVDRHLAGGDVRAVAAMGDVFVALDGSFGVRVFDPGTRTVVGEIAVAGDLRDLSVVDSVAYVLTSSGVPVVDLHDPAAPAMLPPLPASGQFDAVTVAAGFIYGLFGGFVLNEYLMDGTGSKSFSANDAFFPSFTIDEPFVYLPDRRSRLWVVLRSTLRAASILDVGGAAERVVVRRADGPLGPGAPVAWVAESGLTNGRAAVEAYDYTDVIFPTLVRVVPCSGNAVDVAFAGSRMAVAEGSDGFEIFDVAADGSVRPVGYFPEPALRVAASGGRFAVAAGGEGLLLVGFDDCFAAR